MPSLRLAGLDGIVGLHLGIGHSLLVLKLEPQLKPLGLTAKQVTILWLAEANPEITQIEISRFLGIERATIHQFTKSLVRNGMIAIEPSRSDRRATRIHITDKGLSALDQARAIIARHETEATAMLSPIERRLLLDLLTKIHAGA
ncbi:MAG: MarR family transcriptional regulator [Sphingomonadales bacterium]|nr:MarR family transcriptional regulator [Sphingomonadales bacterium]